MKYILIILLGFTFSNNLLSQGLKRINPLINDESFVTTVKKMNKLCKMIYKANRGNIDLINSLGEKANNLQKNLNDEDLNLALVKLTNLPNDYKLVENLIDIQKSILSLKEKFNVNFTNDNIQEAAFEVYRYATELNDLDSGGDGGDGAPCAHPWLFAIASAGCNATASLAFVACASGTSGLGTPLCLYFAGAAQTGCITMAYNSLCK
jgi:hypothetical protein